MKIYAIYYSQDINGDSESGISKKSYSTLKAAQQALAGFHDYWNLQKDIYSFKNGWEFVEGGDDNYFYMHRTYDPDIWDGNNCNVVYSITETIVDESEDDDNIN